ncbi:hypothetical protein DVH24_001620 [Malus domestica]|uniref:Uncharacterized protein n=1 Tax=Malus domestica TaxID=3750 RepID=A0A498KW00_MALDO|nr:hypothetical protein DVH24_001620 [Malus domestica]
MARKNCGVLIRETMIGNHYNPRSFHHHHRMVQTLAPQIQCQQASAIPSSNASASSLASLPARVSASGALSAPGSTVTYSISIVRKIREHFPHVKPYKVLLAVESMSLRIPEKKRNTYD